MKKWKKTDSPPALPVGRGLPPEPRIKWLLKLLKVVTKVIMKWMQNHPKEITLNAPVPAQCVVGKSPLSTERAGGESSGESLCFAFSSRSQALSSLRSDCRASERTIELLVVHCSATWPSIDYTLERLSRDHRARGFGQWPGYHVYIRRDGTVHYCRPVGVAGCHVSGFNQRSIGVCYEGGCSDSVGHKPEDNRTAEQLVAMHEVLKLLREEYPEARIVGHRDLNGGKKACPCFEASSYYAYLK